jgi:hypothetical protein
MHLRPDMQSETSFIAETDEFGRTVWVWQWDGAAKAARPVRDAASAVSRAEGAAVWGASRESVMGWLMDRAAAEKG